MQRVTLIEGDGIGPEVVEATKLVLDAVGAGIEWEPVLVGDQAREAFGEVLPDSVLESIRKNGIGLKGTHTICEGIPSINVRLRKELKLYACVRAVRRWAWIRRRLGKSPSTGPQNTRPRTLCSTEEIWTRRSPSGP